MKIFNLSDMIKGWFIGNFTPAVVNTEHCEVAVKNYVSGAVEPKHFHSVATEITVIVSGRALMNDNEVSRGFIVLVEKGEATNFIALEDTVTVVVKLPSALNDKTIVE